MAERLYTLTHEWVICEGGTATFGISNYAQKALGDVVYVGLPEINATATAGKSVADIESVKAVSDIYAPVSGKVTEINNELEDAPELINKEPLSAWICKFAVNEAPSGMMTEAEYGAYVNSL